MTTNESPTPTITDEDAAHWRTRYRSERRRSKVLSGACVAVSLLAVGLGAWGLSAQGSSAASGPGQLPGGPGTSQMSPPGGAGPAMGQGSGPTQDLASLLLHSDGSVNSDALDDFVSRIPPGALEQILTMAIQNGDLTQTQADAIRQASGTPSTIDSTGAQDT